MVKKRIGILTGGGDVPGLNSVIKTVTYRSSENDVEVVDLRRGWEALMHPNLEDLNSRRRYVMALCDLSRDFCDGISESAIPNLVYWVSVAMSALTLGTPMPVTMS
jgi:hypothetical protein